MADPQAPERKRTTALHDSVTYVAPNVNGRSLQETVELRQQGIEVDNNNDPDPEKYQARAPTTIPLGSG